MLELTDGEEGILSILKLLEEHDATLPSGVFAAISKLKLVFEGQLTVENSKLSPTALFQILQLKKDIERFQDACGILEFTSGILMEGFQQRKLRGIMESSDRGST